MPPAETCNGSDDDCDGATDEGLAGCPTCPRRCEGRECGDDGCGGACGTCAAPASCEGGRCVAPACPVQGCATGAESRDRCSGARVIGRTAAASATGYRIADDTCRASNRSDESGSCWDAGGDHHYRIFLRAGERVQVTLDRGDGCAGYSWNATLKLFSGLGCADTACAARVFCEDYLSDPFSHAYTATLDGWITVVVDGTTAFDDEGDYTLTVRLTCARPGCECP
jgi:hypothetical protein